ncbi:MAG: heme ABC transporter substrate-binding protein IsdE [Anaerotignum sp.]|nr:heme ABC transporter substrate-binding protein IsdE [Anaerotignum sp.]
MKKLKQRMLFLILGLMIFSATACVDQSGAKAEGATTKTEMASAEMMATEQTEDEAEVEKGSEEAEVQAEKEENSGQAEAEAKTEQAKTAAKTQSVAKKDTEVEQRIIATSAATCEIMNRLGIDLVGVPNTTVSTIPSRYDEATRIGTPMAPDMEIIKSLKPTDVIGPDTLEEDLKMKYDNIGVISTFLDLKSVKGLYDSITLMGNKYGKEEEAKALVADYNTFMDDYKAKHVVTKKPKVLVLMGLPGSYLVATNKSYAGSLVELAGGVNVFPSNEKDFLTVNPEEILKTDPDVIIRTAHGLPKEALKMFAKEFSENDIWKHFRAVEEGKVYDVDYMIFGMSATFDYPQALADLEPMLYGE